MRIFQFKLTPLRSCLFSLIAVTVVSFPFYRQARAAEGVYVYLGILPFYWKQTNGDYSVEEKLYLGSDLGLGYVLAENIYLGGTFMYTTYNLKLNTERTNNEHEYTYQAYGPSLGWLNESWSFILSYYAYAEQRDQDLSANPQSTTIRSGTGFGLNVAYRMPFGPIEFGPMVSIKKLTYVNCKDPYSGATSTCDPASEQTEVTPYFAMFYNFK